MATWQFAATTVLSLSLVASGAGASSLTVAADLAFARAHSAPSPRPYLAQAEHYSSEIAARIGHPLSLPITLVVNAKDIKVDGKDVLAYADAENGSGQDRTGIATRCIIHLNPINYNQKDTADFNETLAHEVFHCFEAMDYPSIAAFDHAPNWLTEGAAEWVGETLEPSIDGFWDAYLTAPEIPLFTRAYSAIGFYALITSSGQDTWHLLDPMLRAPSNGAAYSLAANGKLREDWASTLARQPSFGDGWNATGPGIPDDARFNPTTTIVKNGTSLAASLKPYTNGLIKFTSTADVVTITATSPYSRLHEANGKTIDGLMGSTQYCANQCNKCVEMTTMPRLDPGTAWLAETGDVTGASYSVTGGPAMCDACLHGRQLEDRQPVAQPQHPRRVGRSRHHVGHQRARNAGYQLHRFGSGPDGPRCLYGDRWRSGNSQVARRYGSDVRAVVSDHRVRADLRRRPEARHQHRGGEHRHVELSG